MIIRPRLIFAGCLATSLLYSASITAQARDTLPQDAYLEDFDAAWAFVRDNYAYFDVKQTDWAMARDIHRPMAAVAASKRELVHVLERMIEELYDPHAHLGVNTPSSPRLIPSGTDLWAEWQGESAVITAVRSGSEAERIGLRSGMEVMSVGELSVRAAVRARLPRALRAPDPGANAWALLAVLAGRRDSSVKVTTRWRGATRAFEFRPGLSDPRVGYLTVHRLDGDIGYVRVNDALGETGLIAAWDSALMTLRSTRSLVLDLRDTPGGGNTSVARGILSRLIQDEQPYQRHELPAESRRHGARRIWVEHVAPRGPFHYDKPVAVLVGRWTGSMGEGITIGLDAMDRATIVGTRMAGLRGATYGVTLPHTGIVVRVPAERLSHVRGSPREEFIPDVCAPPPYNGTSRDATLDLAVTLLFPRAASPR